VLTREGDGTAVDVTTDMNVTGKPAQFGRGVIQDISDKLLAQFVQCVVGKVGGEAAETPEAAAGTTAEPPAATAADTVEPAGPAATGPPAAAGLPAPQPPASESPSPRSAPAAELDLGSTMGPILMRRFGPAALGVIAVLALVVWMARRRR
ncbi:MAG TPA: carbon monoxide dehydrogenase, partial [Micrococcaceae bacterium]